jgi:hypothetical protein
LRIRGSFGVPTGRDALHLRRGFLRLAVRNDPCAVAIVHPLIRVQPAGGLESRAADKQIVRAGNDFLVTIGANDLNGTK